MPRPEMPERGDRFLPATSGQKWTGRDSEGVDKVVASRRADSGAGRRYSAGTLPTCHPKSRFKQPDPIRSGFPRLGRLRSAESAQDALDGGDGHPAEEYIQIVDRDLRQRLLPGHEQAEQATCDELDDRLDLRLVALLALSCGIHVRSYKVHQHLVEVPLEHGAAPLAHHRGEHIAM